MILSDSRMKFTNALRIAGYSWPLYVAAAIGITVGVVVILLPASPTILRWIAAVGIVVAVWFSCASFWAFHWMFDRSELLGGQWLKVEFPHLPRRWVQINAGLDETTLPMADVFSGAVGETLDLYDPSVMTEPAVARARQGRADTERRASPDSLPVEDEAADLVVVTLAAHEIRDRGKRERFFQELRRVVSPDGTIIVAEHLRDFAAALAFGPGMFHFFPHDEWLRLGKLAGLELERERRITPFVRVFIYRRAAKRPEGGTTLT
jgi:SAM-dependent methyltransferase